MLDWIAWSSKLQSKLSKIIGRLFKMSDYFNLYRIPLSHLRFFDVDETKPLWSPGGIPGTQSIFDHLRQHRHPFEIVAEGSDQERLDQIKAILISNTSAKTLFVVLGELDITMHAHGPESPQVDELLSRYEENLIEAWSIAKQQDPQSELTVFSDHGMAAIKKHLNAKSVIEQLPLQQGRDILPFYDSTMIRVWYFNDEARRVTRQAIERAFGDNLHCLSDREKVELEINFHDHRYGDDIFIASEGFEIVPSYMSRRGNAGMHGYHPSTPSSVAVFGTTTAHLSKIPQSLQELSSAFCETIGIVDFNVKDYRKAG